MKSILTVFFTLWQKIKQNHFFAMVLCCAIPLIGILALSSLGVLGSWGYALLLICPLGHILMMRGMHSKCQDTKMPEKAKELE
ncbi:MAG: DUF2933 domain-containing protein [Desulfobacterales bacterium]|nr:DUF2933 domain-containing protein [Desulfobacterales bacterium]